jgi:hypothetical protein
MGYNPLNLEALQIGLESGGKQLDKNGKPLTSPAGAIGVAQVMPATARETAAKHNIPWDENKYKTDRDYNMRLGDLYQGDLNDEFGRGSVAATAAYNAGPTRVRKLLAAHGSDFAKHLPPETKHYLKVTKGIDVGSEYGDGSAYYPGRGLLDSTASALGIPMKDYQVGQPKPNEGSVQNPTPQLDVAGLQARAQSASDTSDRYTQYLRDAVTPITQNVQQQIDAQKKIVGIKRNIVNDFATREADLESKIRPLMAEREALANKLVRVQSMNPIEQRFKAIFNPNEYDPRMIRGALERNTTAMGIYEENYEELNKLRSGVAAASVDAESADQQTLELGRQSTLSQIQLLGQVVGAVRQNVGDNLLPFSSHVDVLRLEEANKQSLLGKLTLERTVSLYQQAQSSPDGTVSVDGVKLTTGELQEAAQRAQGQDITLRNMINAFKTNDLHTSEEMESHYIDHMGPEQVTEALKNGGKIKLKDGTEYQLSITKLTTALGASQEIRQHAVETVVNSTAPGLANSIIKNLGSQIQDTYHRTQEIFGNTPGEYQSYMRGFSSQIQAWTQGMNAANEQGVGKEYIAKTIGTLNALQTGYDATVTSIAKSWGGGKAELSSVAENYLRGNPLSGDAALKGLVIMARSGIPTGATLSGPAAQAYQVARATVQEWDNPKAGDSADMLQKAMQGQTHKESDLQRLVQQRVQSVYADAMADQIMKDLPQLARSVRDPNNPGRLHPFARVSREDFIMAVRHGDASAYSIVGQKIGVDPQTAKRIFASGPDSAEWQAAAKNKGFSASQFGEFYQGLQALQMSETLAALDASHSAAPGFSPAKAYIDFLNTPEVANRVGQSVQAYGNSGFGPYVVSSSAGGGFRDAWDGYTQSIGAVYQQSHSKDLQNRIQQQRSIGGDPWVRVNAINRAAGLTPAESQTLLQAVKPVVTLGNSPDLGGRADRIIMTGDKPDSRNFDAITTVIRNHRFDDPQIEAIRKKVASQWDAMDAIVGTVFDSVND